MDRSMFTGLLLLVLFAAMVSADTLPEDYWRDVLHNTPMPSILRVLLHPDPHVKYGAGVSSDKVRLHYQIKYHYAATDAPVHVDPTVALFFQEKDLHPNSKMKLDFARNAPVSAFIPRPAADAIPFSSQKLPEILARFSLKPNSAEAMDARQTLHLCESNPTMEGETRYCATSLESMIDFATSSLGTHSVRASSLENAKEGQAQKQQYYTVAPSGAEDMTMGGSTVVCHHLSFPYALFYCHSIKTATKVYAVPLVGEDGSKITAIAVCHVDTSAWDPRHVAFQFVKVKPGTVPICHFLQQDTIVWAPSKTKVAP